MPQATQLAVPQDWRLAPTSSSCSDALPCGTPPCNRRLLYRSQMLIRRVVRVSDLLTNSSAIAHLDALLTSPIPDRL